MRHAVRCGFVMAAVVALAGWMTPASAATFGGEVFGAYNSYAMSDVNDELALQNQSGASFDELSGSITGGLGLRTWANTNWMFSATWEPLPSKTESGTTTLDMNANSFQLNGAYFFPSTSPARFGIGAGAGYYLLNGKVEDTGASEDIKGNGIGFQVLAMSEWQVSPGFAVTGTAGYRNANFDIDAETITELNGKTASYSGLMGRVGLAFYMPSASK